MVYVMFFSIQLAFNLQIIRKLLVKQTLNTRKILASTYCFMFNGPVVKKNHAYSGQEQLNHQYKA